MAAEMDFEARLVKLSASKERGRSVLVESVGEELELQLSGCPDIVYSIVDGEGAVVRCAHRWLSQLSRQIGLTYSSKTVELYGRILSYLCRWLEAYPPHKHLTIDDNIKLLSRSDVLNWLRAMSSAGAESSYTTHTREACLKQFLDWLSTEEGGHFRDSKNSPWGRDGRLAQLVPTPNARSPKFIPTETIVNILNGMHNECERCMFHAQYDMGLRISELVDLRARDLPDSEQYDSAHAYIPICINGAKGRGGTKKERVTLISRALLRRIKRYHSSPEYKLAPDWSIKDPDKPVFLTVNQRQWSVRNASKQFKSAVRRVGALDAMKTHWMRHGTAYSVLRSDMGKDYQDRMLMVQQMLGHAHLTTTEIYTQIPAAMLTALTRKGKEINRLDEAETIRESTYLGPLQHTERRGHRE